MSLIRSLWNLAAPTSALALLMTAGACGDDGTTASASDGASESDSDGESGESTDPASGSGSTQGATDSGGSESESATGSTGDPSTDGSTGEPATTTDTTDATTTDTTDATTTDTTDTETTGGVDGFMVGVDVTDISPTEQQLGPGFYMGAYGAPYTRGPAQGVHDAIYVRSFAIEAGDGLILAIMDLPGMGNQISRAIREDVAAATGLSEDQVLIGATHSHSAPDLMGLWGGVPDSYKDMLIDKVAASMTAAWDGRVTATLEVGTATVDNNNNRRGHPDTDKDIVVLDAFDEGQARLGTLVAYAAHPVILGEDNKLISRDFCGYTVDALELELDAPVLFFNGVLGDASPKSPPGEYADDFEKAQAYGELLASSSMLALEQTEPVDPVLVFTASAWEQKVDNLLFQAAANLGLALYDFEMMGLFENYVTTQATYFRLGTQLQGVGFPGESLTYNGLSIKEVMKTPHRLLLGNTGDALGYFVPSAEWNMGYNDNYEESVSLGPDAGDTARDVINALITADNANF
ncbi:MAG: neutral/alkaline non-lysosomal ceramidase N-terminal domain-containing protein [Myxococcales bacterium]|nr:neutral/alkaline non-lysosomal ceramidase N-terminal domain-containing protein [Myxococcales bacterium]